MAWLCSGDLSPQEFVKLVQDHAWPTDSILMAFSPAEARLQQFTSPDGSFLSRTDQGRIFSPEGELRWRRLSDEMRTVYLGDSPPGGLPDCSAELDGLAPAIRQLLLWGVRTETDNEWLEQQVPHRFVYPVESARFARGRVALKVEDWKDSARISRFSRYHSIVEVEGGE